MQSMVRTLGVAIAALLLTAHPTLAQPFQAAGFNLGNWLKEVLVWIDGLGAIAPLAFMGIYIVATVALVPGTILTLGAGVVFGVIKGATYVFMGASLGATAAFLIGRYLARGWVSQKIEGNSKFKAIDKGVSQEGFKIVLLTRLSPVFPFNLLNYALGLTGVSLKDYVMGFVGMIPGTVMYVYFGSLAGNLATIGSANQPTNPSLQWALRIIGFIATVAVTVYVTRIARKALDEQLEATEAEPPESANS